MTAVTGGLPPVDPQILARRRRVNRILVALLVMLVLPVASVYGGNHYIESQVMAWRERPTFNVGVSTTITIDKAGKWAVWSYPAGVTSCDVNHGGLPVTVSRPDESAMTSLSGFTESFVFQAPGKGDYTIECQASDPTTYVFVSTEYPLGTMTTVYLLSWVVAIGAAITGVILLIVGLVKNSNEKQPAIPTMPGVPPWPPQY